MGRPTHRYSFLSQKLDRAAFAAYFLGAVVPLVTLVWVTHRYVLAALPDAPGTYRILGLVLSTGFLSLASFLLLRRITRQCLARLEGHNLRLQHLLEASRAVADAPYAGEVCRLAAESARSLLDLRAALVVTRNDKEPDRLELEGGAGDDAQAIFAGLGETLGELLERAEGRSLVRGAARVAGGMAELAAAPLVEEGAAAGAVVAVRLPGEPRFSAGEASSLSTLATLASVARHNAELRDSQRNFFAHATEILVTALDAHMDLQQGHARRVAHFAVLVGRELGFAGERLERLHFAGLLHDIGMLKIRSARAGGQAAFRQHPLLGYRMLKPIRLWEELAPIVLHHHEWFDGRGYPEGLSGEAIPLESRILALAEAFDSMTSRRSYREPLGLEGALQEVRVGAGTQFDPTLARLFVELCERGVIRLLQEG